MEPRTKALASIVGALIAAILWTGTARPAAAQEAEVIEPWFLTLEAGATGPLTDPIYNQFGVGFMGGAGVFYSLMPELAIGGRVSAGFLSAGSVIPQDPVDRGMLDMGLITPVLRVRPFGSIHETHRRATGLWIELAPGAGLTDGDPVFAYQIGLGYGIGAGPVSIGPFVRLTHFVETEGRFGDNQIVTGTAGIELAFPDRVTVIEPELPAEPEPLAVNPDRDGDGIPNDQDECPDQPETFNGFEDEDGCPDEGEPEFVNDALIVDERVFFDFDSSELRETGMRTLDVVIGHWEQYGDRYERLEVNGHADERGSREYNDELSARRAREVRKYLTDRGVPEGILDLHAYGESMPAIPNAETEYEHQVNRRVEFRVIWEEGARPEGLEPEPNPTMPEHVDEAPPNRRGPAAPED